MRDNSNYYEYLHVKIQQNNELKKEVEQTKILIEQIEEQKSLIWINSIYYVIKRSILFLLIIGLGYTLFTTYSKTDSYLDIIKTELQPALEESYNETFGKKVNLSGSYSDPFNGELEIKSIYRENLNQNFLNKIINEDILNLMAFFRIVLLITICILIYILRLTRIMYRKNKLIEALYKDQIENLSLFENLYESQKAEIEQIKNL